MTPNPYLVTGANGFTGTHLITHLRNEGKPVRALVRRPEAAQEVRSLGVDDVIVADLSEREILASALENVAGVFHIAAAFRRAGIPDVEYIRVNVEGTRNLLELSVEKGVERFVHCSTVGVISNTKTLPADEEVAYAPGDIYQRTKMEGEKLALKFFRETPLQGVVIRPAMIYGPGDLRMLKLFRMVANERFFYVGAGEARVHFIHVDDLARAFSLAMAKAEHLNGETFIIAGEKALPLNEFVRRVASCFGVRPPWLHLPVSPMQALGTLCETICTPLGIEPPLFRRRVDFFTKERWFETSRAAEKLDFSPSKSSLEEIEDLCRWYYEHGYINREPVGSPKAQTDSLAA